MLAEIRDAVIASVRLRASQGDCPVEPAHSVETLENVILDLAAPPREVLTEEWLADVLQDSLDMDWTTTDGARAIMKALKLATLDNTAVEGLRALVREMLDNLKHCSLNSGSCHCGDSMDRHADPMSCGHTPVDMGWTAAEAWIGKAEAALVGEEYAK